MAEFIDMTEERMAALAEQFGVSVEEVRREWEMAQTQGPDATLDSLNDDLAAMEADIDEVLPSVEIGGENRYRQMATLYGDAFEAATEGPESTSVPDLVLKLAITLYRLAEAEAEVKRLRGLLTGGVDGNRRSGRLRPSEGS